MQYLYKDDRYHFMDTETYDRSPVARRGGPTRATSSRRTRGDILFIDGSPVTVELPTSWSSHLRPIRVSRGHRLGRIEAGSARDGRTIQVPLFLNEATSWKVDTRSAEYLSRWPTAG